MDVTLRNHLRIAVRSMFIAGGVFTAGCAELRIGPVKSPPPPPTEQTTESPPVQEKDEKEQSTLAAVEEFLDRTQQYRSAANTGTILPPESAKGTESKNAAGPLPERERSLPALIPDQAFANTQVTLTDTAPSKPPLAIPAVESVSIRWDEPGASKNDTPPTNHTTNTSIDLKTDDATNLAERLLKTLQAEVQRRHDPGDEWRFRLAQVALYRHPEPVVVSSEIAEPARTMLLAFLDATVAVRKNAVDPSSSAQTALEKVERLREELAQRSDPIVATVALCKKVVTFGVYEEMAKEDFVAGRSIQTIVYSGLNNLRAQKNDDGSFETKLVTRLEVLTSDGKSVWQREEPEILDRCRQRRWDFFLAQRITLPPTLPAGEYVLKVFVEDRLANRADEASTTFAVLAPVSIAAKKSSAVP